LWEGSSGAEAARALADAVAAVEVDVSGAE